MWKFTSFSSIEIQSGVAVLDSYHQAKAHSVFLFISCEIYFKNTRKTTEVTQFSLGFSRESHQSNEILRRFTTLCSIPISTIKKSPETYQNFTALAIFSRETKWKLRYFGSFSIILGIYLTRNEKKDRMCFFLVVWV